MAAATYPTETLAQQKEKRGGFVKGQPLKHVPPLNRLELDPASQLSSTNFRPYTLKEYREKTEGNYLRLGGLGANIGSDEWNRGKAKLDAAREFSKNIGKANKERLAYSKKMGEAPKEKSARERALEFARRRVHRPKMKSSSADSPGRMMEEEDDVPPRMHELYQLDTHRQEYCAQLEKIKMLYN